MKKLIAVFLFSLLFVSCSNLFNKKDKKAKTPDWDKDGIAYINNSSFVPEDLRSEDGTYVRTGFKRLSGSAGIIGKFQRTTQDTSNLYNTFSEIESYVFDYDTGKVSILHRVTSGNSTTKNFNDIERFHLYKFSDTIFIVEIESYKTYFYEVSGNGINLFDEYTDGNGTTYYAHPEMKKLKASR